MREWQKCRVAALKCIRFKYVCLFFIFFIVSDLFSQVSGKLPLTGKKNIITGIYKFETLESFENDTFFNRLSDISDTKSCFLANKLPAPVIGSEKYLVIRLHDAGKTQLVFDFKDKYIMNGFVRSVKLWVYSPYLPGRLRLILEDTEGNDYTLQSQKLVFRGWRELTFRTDKLLNQNDYYVKQFRPMFLKRILYFPGPGKRLQGEQLLFLDEITYESRPKYIIPENK